MTKNLRKARRTHSPRGVGQLTLVEHALCPLDSRASLAENAIHESQFNYSDRYRHRRTGRVRVLFPLGLSPHDELYLWGCLALTIADSQSGGQLVATRHYVLRQLGLIDTRSRRGGRQYADLTAAIERLSTVRYMSDGFYDPIRGEHRKVGFGFFSYSLPLDPNSSRAWRIVWDPVFFEFAQAAGGSLRFDLGIYRKLDPASRRLFLFVTKLFARKQQTYPLDVVSLAVNVLGFSASLRASDLKLRVSRYIDQLAEHGVVAEENRTMQKTGVGKYLVVLRKGPAYSRSPRFSGPTESPLLEPLREIGFDGPAINHVLRRFPQTTLREWVDITLAAKERFGISFFRRTPAAYLMDNLQAAAAGTRTAPDWWHDLRKAEERARVDRLRNRRKADAETDSLPTKAIEIIDDIHASIFGQFQAEGQTKSIARANTPRFHAVKRKRIPRK